MSTETELKLRIKPDLVGRLRRHPLLRELRLSAARTRKLRNVYFDTDDMALRKNRIALRVRHDGIRRVQTLKTPDQGPSGAAQRYREYESAIDGDRPKLELIADGELRDALPAGTQDQLKEAFTSEITRSTVPLCLAETKIELAVDRGEIAAADKREAVCEAELELKSGRPSRIYELALKLHEEVPFTVEYRSKAARGYDLLLGEKPKPRKSAEIELDAAMTAWQGFAAIARSCLAQLRANEDCVRQGEDPEGVHQLRVGLRRLRAAFALFVGVLPEEQRRHFVDELRWAQQRLGPARDWDVFIADTVNPLRGRLPEDANLRALAVAASAARAIAYKQASATLDDRRYTRMQLQLDLWLESGGGDGAADNETGDPRPWMAPIGGVARTVLDKRHRKIRKLAKRFDDLNDEERHELRIDGKKGRYAAEFFRSLFQRKAALRYAKRLSEMQDCLGSMNDAVVGHRLIDELAGASAKGRIVVERSSGILKGWFAARIAADMPQASRISRKIAKIKPFWE
ncbi:MAG: CYTH and CHAD domain-containing protein [Rhodospirillales bacterium]